MSERDGEEERTAQAKRASTAETREDPPREEEGLEGRMQDKARGWHGWCGGSGTVLHIGAPMSMPDEHHGPFMSGQEESSAKAVDALLVEVEKRLEGLANGVQGATTF